MRYDFTRRVMRISRASGTGRITDDTYWRLIARINTDRVRAALVDARV